MASTLVRFGIPSIALTLAALFVWAVAHSAQSAGLGRITARRQGALAASGVALFLGAIAALALSGALGRFDLLPPPLLFWVLSTLGAALGVAFSPLGRRLAAELPLAVLVGFQAFRLPLELVMHRAAEDHVMPSVMSYGGYNFDIVSGITAALLGAALVRGPVPRALVVAWNVVGSTLLAIIVVVAFLATPLVRAFGDDQVNRWITQFPYAWMAVMVASALLGHVLVARKLVADRSVRAVVPARAGASSNAPAA